MVTGVDTIWVPVQDMDRMRAFYEGALGLAPHFASPEWTAYTLGPVQLGLHAWGEMPAARPTWIPAFTVMDLAAARQRLQEAGCECSPPHETPRGVLFQTEDPEGNAFQVFQSGSALADFA